MTNVSRSSELFSILWNCRGSVVRGRSQYMTLRETRRSQDHDWWFRQRTMTFAPLPGYRLPWKGFRTTDEHQGCRREFGICTGAQAEQCASQKRKSQTCTRRSLCRKDRTARRDLRDCYKLDSAFRYSSVGYDIFLVSGVEICG